MPIHILNLLDREEVASNTHVFTFSKPPHFIFQPGQYGGFTLINPSEKDAGGITRRFSFLNSPDDQVIQIATRIQDSAYKRALNQLAIGSEIKMAGPSGQFVLHEDATIPAVLIAGGIGITPFYSMIQTVYAHSPSRVIYLFYGNQSPQDAAFLTTFFTWQQQHPSFHFIPTMAMPDPAWEAEVGYITPTLIKKNISNLQLPLYYVCGSPAMVSALQETLIEMDVSEDKIKVEDFPGY